MIETHAIAPAKLTDDASDASAQETTRRPLRELLPRAARARAVGFMSVLAIAGSFVAFGLTGHALLGAILCPVLVLLAAIDFEHQLLPNDIIFPAVLAVGLVVAAANPGGFLTHLAAGAVLGGFFLLFAVVFKGGLGIGDAKLGFLLGLALGWDTMTATLIAFAGLLVAALWILARQGLGARRKAIPFGPFLAIGGIVAYFLG
jgi:prepilin signal peptidase PulO-like enzyme (type II secretory pathway)